VNILKNILWVSSIITIFLFLYIKLNETETGFQIVQNQINSKNYASAVEKAISEFKLDKRNCQKIEITSIPIKISNIYIVAQTNFNQIVSLNPKGDVFISAERLITTLFHEFRHCDQNQALYSFLIKKNKVFEYLKLKFPRLADFAIASEFAAENPQSETSQNILSLEKVIAAQLSPLSNFLRNFFEIDAIYHVLQSQDLFFKYSNQNEEFLFNIEYLKKSFEDEAKKNMILDVTKYNDVCNSLKNNLVDELSILYLKNCLSAAKMLYE